MENSINEIHSYSILSASGCAERMTGQSDIEQVVAQCFSEDGNSWNEESIQAEESVSQQEGTNTENNKGQEFAKIIEVFSGENVENIFCIDNVKQEYTVTELDGTTFNIQPLAYQDLNVIYSENGIFHVCDVCNKSFRKKSNLTRHYRSHTGDNPHACDQCDAKFPTMSRLKEHLHAHTGLRPYVCNMCNKTFSRVSNLTRHLRTHNSEKLFGCDKCNSRFVELTRLREHYLTHVGEKRFACEVCGKKFLKKYNLKRHSRTHSGDLPHKCGTCGRNFSKKFHLLVHAEAHAKNIAEVTINDLVVVEADSAITDVALNCIVDGTEYGNQTAVVADEEGKVFTCTQCKRRFLKKSSLISHEKRHAEKKCLLSCDVCDATFPHASRLMEHSVTHSKEKLYSCVICERSFGRNSNLLRHLEIHTGEKRFSCDFCLKRFRNNSRLKEHVLLHSGDRPHSCNVCNKMFRHRFALQRHLLTHTNEKPHKCEYCGRKFSRKNQLDVHLKKHKPGDAKFPNRIEPRLMNIIQNLEARLNEPDGVENDKHDLRSSKRKKIEEQSEEMEELTVQVTSADPNVVSFHNLRSRSKCKPKTLKSKKEKFTKSEIRKSKKHLHKKKSSKDSLKATKRRKSLLKKITVLESTKPKNKSDSFENNANIVDQSLETEQIIIDDMSDYQTQMIDNSLDSFVVVKSAL